MHQARVAHGERHGRAGPLRIRLQIDLSPTLRDREVTYVIDNVVDAVGVQINALTYKPLAALLRRAKEEGIRLRTICRQRQDLACDGRNFGTGKRWLRELSTALAEKGAVSVCTNVGH